MRSELSLPRRVFLVIAALVLVAIGALILNAVLAERDVEPARADVGRILRLPGGDMQIREDGPRDGPALVLIHGWTGSMRWWDRVTPALAERHRVVRIDLLGHGGSAKPRRGYEIEAQADRVAAAIRRLGVTRARVVAHSLGGTVAASLSERHRPLVDRLMLIGTSPAGAPHVSLIERLPTLPVIGQAVRSLAPDAVIRGSLEQTFIEGTKVPENFIDALDRMTWNAFHDSAAAGVRFRKARNLPDRLTDAGVPLLVVFGARDNVADPRGANDYRRVPDARVETLPDLGHSPQVERPDLIIRRIAGWSR